MATAARNLGSLGLPPIPLGTFGWSIRMTGQPHLRNRLKGRDFHPVSGVRPRLLDTWAFR
jgi:hypothetical protein